MISIAVLPLSSITTLDVMLKNVLSTLVARSGLRRSSSTSDARRGSTIVKPSELLVTPPDSVKLFVELLPAATPCRVMADAVNVEAITISSKVSESTLVFMSSVN